MLNATFRQLTVFVLAAQAGRFSAAADSMGVSPAAVSDHIRKLERRIGYALFDRRQGAPPELSEKGRAFLKLAPDLLALAADVGNISQNQPPPIKKVKVGAGEYILEQVLYPNLPRFLVDHPDVQVEFVRLAHNTDGARAVHDGRCDLAYLTLSSDSESLGGRFIGAMRHALFVSPRHPFAKGLPGSDGRRLPVIMPLSGSGAERFRVRSFASAGLGDYDVVARAEHSQTQLALTVAGVGVCCLLYGLAEEALAAGDLVDLGVEFPEIHRWDFCRENALDVEHIRLVDRFVLQLLDAEKVRSPARGALEHTLPV